jgi:hypothetical protein
LRKASISFVMSIRPFVRMKQLGSHCTDFHEISYFIIFRKTVQKNSSLIKIGEYKGVLYMKTSIHFLSHLPQFFLEWEMFCRKAVEDKETQILCSKTFYKNRALQEIKWRNIVERGRPRITICRMRISYWIPKAANTHSEYVTLTAFPLQ